jgi:hypothetical protein
VNRRLVTPIIVVVSFTVAFGLMSWQAGLWSDATAHTPPDSAAAPLARTPSVAAIAASSLVSAPPAPPEPPQQNTDSAPEPQPPAVDPDAFLDARDRAAAHGARSR